MNEIVIKIKEETKDFELTGARAEMFKQMVGSKVLVNDKQYIVEWSGSKTHSNYEGYAMLGLVEVEENKND